MENRAMSSKLYSAGVLSFKAAVSVKKSFSQKIEVKFFRNRFAFIFADIFNNDVD